MGALILLALVLGVLAGAAAVLCLAAIACNPNNLDSDEL